MSTAYITHLLYWTLPIIALQWTIAWRIFLRNRRAIVLPPLAACLYYSLTDFVAIREGIWHFDSRQILGAFIGPVPIEEILFFYLTAQIVAQSVVMLLPERYRR